MRAEVSRTAGGSAANCIAKWNGSSWSALGSGMGGGFTGAYVDALAVSGSDLYAGGSFTTAGGSTANVHCQMEREQLVGLGVGDEQQRVCAGGVGQ